MTVNSGQNSFQFPVLVWILFETIFVYCQLRYCYYCYVYYCESLFYPTTNRLLWAAIAQSVYWLATGWTVRGSKPGVSEIFRTHPDRSWGPPSLLYSGYRVFLMGVKRPGRGVDRHSPSVPTWPILWWSLSFTINCRLSLGVLRYCDKVTDSKWQPGVVTK